MPVCRYNVSVYNSATSFLGESRLFDLVFLDIDMPQINGIQTARALRDANQNVAIIFVTNMAQYALQGYEVNAIDFIVKPVAYYNFAIKMRKAEAFIWRMSSKTINIVTANRETYAVESGNIAYVEVMEHYVTYHMADGSAYETRSTMKETEEKLSAYSFARCSKSFLVNLRYVSYIKGNEIGICGQTIAIGGTKKKSFMDSFSRYLGGLK